MNSSVISKSAQFRAENKDKDEDEGKRIKVSSEKSTGRAIQSNYYFPFSNLLTKPSRPINNDKVVVYPTYNRNTFNDNYQTRNQLKVMMPSTGKLKNRNINLCNFIKVEFSFYKLKIV
jgi:hypothetical protein